MLDKDDRKAQHITEEWRRINVLQETNEDLMNFKKEVEKKTEQEVRKMFHKSHPLKIKLLLFVYSKYYRYTFLLISTLAFICAVVQSSEVAPLDGKPTTQYEKDLLKACLITQLVLSVLLIIDSVIKFVIRGKNKPIVVI